MRNIHNAKFFIPYIYIMHDICPIAKKSMSRKSLLGKMRNIHDAKLFISYTYTLCMIFVQSPKSMSQKSLLCKTWNIHVREKSMLYSNLFFDWSNKKPIIKDTSSWYNFVFTKDANTILKNTDINFIFSCLECPSCIFSIKCQCTPWGKKSTTKML